MANVLTIIFNLLLLSFLYNLEALEENDLDNADFLKKLERPKHSAQ